MKRFQNNMGFGFILILLIIGLSGMVAQVLLLRELLVSFYGNELTLGLILGNWVALEALGAFIFGKYIDKAKNRIKVFLVLESAFILLLPVSIYFCRAFKYFLGIAQAEAIGLSMIFAISLVAALPISFCHGAIFSVISNIYSGYSQDNTGSIARVYAWEAAGTIIGGIALTYLFIPLLNSFQIIAAIFIANILACFFAVKFIEKIRLSKIKLFAFILSSIVVIMFLNRLQGISINQQWLKNKVLDYRNSIYGNVVVTEQKKQYTFFYNGIPIITAPFPDKQFVEEFGHLPLLFQAEAQNVLVVSAGAGGLINEILKHPVEKLDYVELDPLIIRMLKDYPTELTKEELNDRRVRVINRDARFFLKTNQENYDVILIGFSNQSDLATNRFFTREFFFLVKEKLNQKGVFALWLPGSLAYLSSELKNINISVLNSLKATFLNVRIIPGDYNIYMASPSKELAEIKAEAISERIGQLKLNTSLLIPDYLKYRLSSYWLDWFLSETKDATKELNLDLKPIAVFQTLIFWNKKFAPGVSRLLDFFRYADLRYALFCIILLTALLAYPVVKRRNLKAAISYSIFTTGFFGMLSTLLLIFAFQVFYGYLYHRLGFLISFFMLGTVCGSLFISRYSRKFKRAFLMFILFEAVTAIFSFLMALALSNFHWFRSYESTVFFFLFFACGFLIGAEFPLASNIYLAKEGGVGSTVGVLYACDLAGGWFAGLTGGIILLPILGLFNTCLIMLMLKASSLILVLCFRLTKKGI
ncbi:MAG: hypothetical protein AB1481_02715 [Candidatus Omnitrophota bacterium]